MINPESARPISELLNTKLDQIQQNKSVEALEDAAYKARIELLHERHRILQPKIASIIRADARDTASILTARGAKHDKQTTTGLWLLTCMQSTVTSEYVPGYRHETSTVTTYRQGIALDESGVLRSYSASSLERTHTADFESPGHMFKPGQTPWQKIDLPSIHDDVSLDGLASDEELVPAMSIHISVEDPMKHRSVNAWRQIFVDLGARLLS